MTREDCNNAIKVLKNYDLNNSKVNSLLFSAEEITNAFDIAIKALEQQSEDAISRVDALKALDYDIKSFEFKSGVSRHMNEIANLLNTIYEIQSDNIKALPSVQPKYNTSEWCHDCSEYDHEKHCCSRYNKVIRNTVEEMKQPCEDKIIEWKKDFKEYVNSLSIPRDDYKGIMEYIDELPITPQEQ